MTAPHFLVFVGAGPTLSTELQTIAAQAEATVVVAPAVGKSDRGLTRAAIQRAIDSLVLALERRSEPREPARLSVWSYIPGTETQFSMLWSAFGKSALIEFVPATLENRDRPTRMYVADRTHELLALIHLIAHSVYNERKSSPLSLPFRNFKSKVLAEFGEYWYRDANLSALRRAIEKSRDRFRQLHRFSNAATYRDDRSLFFSGARDSECHGQPHPTGEANHCYVDGRFRFGAALFPGFHYDVRSEAGLLEGTLYDCNGTAREMKPEKRSYINIFPNDHLLPGI